MDDREQWAIAVCVNAMRVKNQTATGVHLALLGAGFTGPEARAAISEVMKRHTQKEPTSVQKVHKTTDSAK